MGSSGSKEVLHTSKLILDVPKCKGLYDQTLCLGLGYSPTVNAIAEPDRDHGDTLVTLEIGGEVGSEDAGQETANLQQKATEKGGQALRLEAGQTFEVKKDRGCTDILFLIIWIVFCAGMLAIAIAGLVTGEPARLQYGYDFNGQVCGMGAMEGRPFVYYPFPFPKDMTGKSLDGADFTWATCVKQCPDQRPPKIPNSCMQMFQVPTEAADRVDPFPMGPNVMCGAKDDGKPSEDGSTDMGQFGVRNFIGYSKYCLKYNPLCICKKNEPDNIKSSCCTPNAAAGEVGSQAVKNGLPQVQNLSETLAKKQFGILMGHQYGFCYLPYPSFVPGPKKDTTGTGSWTRCMPLVVKGAGNFSSSLTLIERASDSTSSSGNSTSSGSQKDKDEMMDKAMAAVMKSMSGLVTTLMGPGPGESAKMLVEQVRKYKWVIAACAGISLLVSILYTFLLKVAAFPLVLTIMLGTWVMLGGALAMLGLKAGYIDAKSIPGSDYALTQMPAGVTFGPAQTNQALVVAACVLVGICFVAYSLVVCIMVPRLRMACKVIDIASVCLASMPTALLFPVIQFFCSVIFFGYFCIVLWYLASAGTWDPDARRYVWNEHLQRLMAVHFFGLLWGQAFILAVGNLAIAGAAAEWFLADDKKMFSSPAISSALRACRYHLGTCAFGSFIIAVVQMIRWVFRYYMYQLKKLDANGTFKHIIAIMACIGECCLSCLERFLNFINKNAYIQTAITGNSFCTAAKDASMLLLRNCLRVGTLQIIASAFIFLGKYFIALVVAIVSAIWMVALDSGGSVTDGWANVSSAPVFPVTIVFILAFNIACAFLDVWDMVIDTIFQCYCMDEEYGTGKSPGELKTCVAENPPTAKDLKALDAVTPGSGAAPGSGAGTRSAPLAVGGGGGGGGAPAAAYGGFGGFGANAPPASGAPPAFGAGSGW